jgi:hypothetical protein
MITLYAHNLVDQANITASTENLLFPASNIKDHRRTKVFRSTQNDTSLVFDLLETSEIDSFAIVSNPKTGFGVSTITIEANATDEWSSPAFSTTMTFSTKHGIGIKELTSSINYRFVRFVFTSTLGYSEVANLFIGKKTVPSRGINYNWTFRDDDLSIVKENRYGQKFVDRIGRQRLFSGMIQNLDEENIEILRNICDVKGKIKPFFIKIGCQEAMEEPERFMAMVFFSNIPTNTNRHYSNWGFPIQLEEAK